MKKRILNIQWLFLFPGLFFACAKPDTQVGYYVFLTKKVDSLPCEVEVSFPDRGKIKNVKIGADWSFSQKINYDQGVTLKARSLGNIKSLRVEIYAKEAPVSESCDSLCTEVSVSKNLYE